MFVVTTAFQQQKPDNALPSCNKNRQFFPIVMCLTL